MSALTLEKLETIITTRADATDGSSYTASLVAKGMPQATKKLGKEAFETVIAALSEDEGRLISESVDLVYHLLIVWKIGGIRLADVLNELETRTARSGLQEKAARPHD